MAHAPDEVLGYWSTLVEGLQEPPLEFYASVEAAVMKRNIPDAKFERIEYREGGAFSAFRQYLRVRRYREVFDICGAPFGNGCFFSWWFTEVRPQMPAIVSILIVFAYLYVIGLLIQEGGFIRGPITFALLVALVLFIVRRMGTPRADDFILMLPLIGPLYARVFRPITYYRLDTSAMFQAAIRAAVMEVVDQVTSTRGLRPLTEFERKPVMRDFFQK